MFFVEFAAIVAVLFFIFLHFVGMESFTLAFMNVFSILFPFFSLFFLRPSIFQSSLYAIISISSCFYCIHPFRKFTVWLSYLIYEWKANRIIPIEISFSNFSLCMHACVRVNVCVCVCVCIYVHFYIYKCINVFYILFDIFVYAYTVSFLSLWSFIYMFFFTWNHHIFRFHKLYFCVSFTIRFSNIEWIYH